MFFRYTRTKSSTLSDSDSNDTDESQQIQPRCESQDSDHEKIDKSKYVLFVVRTFELLRVGSIPSLHPKIFGQLFSRTIRRNKKIKAQWHTQSRYICHCPFLFCSFFLTCIYHSEKFRKKTHVTSIIQGGHMSGKKMCQGNQENASSCQEK